MNTLKKGIQVIVDKTIYNNNIYSIKGINGSAPIKARMHGTFLRLKLDTKTRQKFNIFAITIKYRKSYN